MQSPVDEIKARLDIVDIIGTYVQLKRAGANFKALCPFHSEKTPSFMVSKPKQMWYCFGCSEGGDIFKFVMKIEGLEFPEALKILADKAGVALPRFDKQTESKKSLLLEIMKEAVAYYAAELGGPRGALAREYMARRGVSEAMIKQFALGYAPDSWDALTGALRGKFKDEDVLAAGLTVRSERNQGFYDRFRHRIMFPIRDVHGNAVGFTSRILEAPTPSGVGAPTSPSANVGGKYVNTPETLIYNKSRVLYGLDLARETIRKMDYAVIVEGNMDVIACHQFGMTNAVASSGTALAIDQVRLLKRYTNNLKIAFDADPAGESAAKRGIDVALAEGMRVKVITIPAGCGKDPDECVRKDMRAWESAVREAKEIMEYYVEKARTQFDVSTATGRSQFVNTLLAEIVRIPDLVEQDFWIKKVGEMVKVDERLLREQMRRLGNSKLDIRNSDRTSPISNIQYPISNRPRTDVLSERLLALFLAAPSNAPQIIGNVLPEMLSPDSAQDLYIKLVACYTAYNSQEGVRPPGRTADFRAFWRTWAAKEAPQILSTADIAEMLGDKEFEGWEEARLGQEVQFLNLELRREYLKVRRLELAASMRQAEQAGDTERVSVLTREFEELAVRE